MNGILTLQVKTAVGEIFGLNGKQPNRISNIWTIKTWISRTTLDMNLWRWATMLYKHLLICAPMFSQEHCKGGEALLKRLERWEDVSSAELQVYEVKVRSFWVHLQDFSQRVEDTRDKIDKTVKLYEFFDKVRPALSLFLLAAFVSPGWTPLTHVCYFNFVLHVTYCSRSC